MCPNEPVIDHRLLGHWISAPDAVEHITIDFGRDGEMVYSIHDRDGIKKIFLQFTTLGGVITTNQQSAPRYEKTNYEFTADGSLILTYRRMTTKYVCLRR